MTATAHPALDTELEPNTYRWTVPHAEWRGPVLVGLVITPTTECPVCGDYLWRCPQALREDPVGLRRVEPDPVDPAWP